MRIFIATLIAYLLIITGCGKGKPAQAGFVDKGDFPKVNSENCRKENIEKLPTEKIEAFTTLCVRSSESKKSEYKEW